MVDSLINETKSILVRSVNFYNHRRKLKLIFFSILSALVAFFFLLVFIRGGKLFIPAHVIGKRYSREIGVVRNV